MLRTKRRERKGTHVDAVFPGRGHNLARVELERRDRVVVLEGVEDPAGAQVPDLTAGTVSAQPSLETRFGRCAYAYRFVEASADDVELVELDARHGTRVSQERSMWLACAHCIMT